MNVAERLLARQIILAKTPSLLNPTEAEAPIFIEMMSDAFDENIRTLEEATLFYLFYLESDIKVSARFTDLLLLDLKAAAKVVRRVSINENVEVREFITDVSEEIDSILETFPPEEEVPSVPSTVLAIRRQRDEELAAKAIVLQGTLREVGVRARTRSSPILMKLLFLIVALMYAYILVLLPPEKQLLIAQYPEPPGSTLLLPSREKAYSYRVSDDTPEMINRSSRRRLALEN